MTMKRLRDPKDVVQSAVGRPRTALWLGGSSGASLAEEQGAVVSYGEGASGGPFDLVFLTGDAARRQRAAMLAHAVGRLSDGGHVVVEHGRDQDARDVGFQLRGAGLEPLWCDGHVGRPTLTVARKPPEKRKLSVTVGMISMNEAGAVGGVIDSIRSHCPDAEILLVDSSKDETPAIAEGKGARVLRQFPPRGYGPAMTRLLYSATTDVIITMDCDGTYPAERIPDLLKLVEQGADLVNASRTHRRPSAMPLPNYVANRTFATVAGAVHRFSTTDVHSGMRAYRTSMLRGVHVPEKGPALPVELIIVPARHGYRVVDVNIDYMERIGSSTLQRWDSTVWTFRRIARAAWLGGRSLA